MGKTLTVGEHRLAFTAGVNDRIADDAGFAGFVWQSLARFNRGDWGTVGPEDWKANDSDLESLNNGGWYGRILAAYTDTTVEHSPGIVTTAGAANGSLWIIRNTAEEDGTQAILVLFPEEY
jgi:hypothetical protein